MVPGQTFVVLTALMLLVAVLARRAASGTVEPALFPPAELIAGIAAGRIDEVELRLRERLATGNHAEWLDRAQLAELLVLRGAYREAASLVASPGEAAPWNAVAAFVDAETFVLGRRNLAADPDQLLERRDHAVVYVPSEARPGYVAAWDALRGVCLVRLGHDADAMPLLVQGLAESLHRTPTRAVYVFHLARALHRTGHHAAARARYEEAMALAPGTPWSDGATLHLAQLADDRGS